MIRHRGAFSLALLLGSVNAACVNLRPPPVPIASTLAGDAPTPVWTARAGRRLTGTLETRDNTLYGGGTDRKVYAVNLQSGEVRWSTRLPGMIAGGVLLSGDMVYAASSRPEGRIVALRADNGKQIWRTSTEAIGAPLAMVGGTLIAESQRGNVLALDPATGKIRWHRRLGVSRVRAVSGGNGAVLVATTDSLFRLGPGGKVLRRAPSPGVILSPWIRMGDGLVAGTTDSLVVSIRLSDLRSAWRVKVDAPVVGAPATSGDTVYAVSRRGTLYRITGDSAVTANPIVALSWPVTAPVTVLDGAILLGGADGTIRALRPEDGRELWRLRLLSPIELSPIPLPDGMLAIGGNGDIHRYRQ